MKKIISLYQRNYGGDRLVRDEVTPGAEWVVAGEGVATRKFDGTCCLVRNGRMFKRYEVKSGGKQPNDFEPACDIDEVTGKQQGWVPVIADDPENKWHMQAWRNQEHILGSLMGEHTFELCGPKVQGNPESGYVVAEVGHGMHLLIPHGKYLYGDCPRTFEAVKEFIRFANIEGVVWHHEDGRMVKIKGRDFGITRGKK